MKKDIILTFDYELFLGKDSGSLKGCIGDVTDDILNVFKKHGGVGIFFVDSSYLVHLKKNCIEEHNAYSDLIRNIVKGGHDIGLHIHPHWLDATKKENGHWDLSDYSRYRLHSLTPNELQDYFKECLDNLQNIVASVRDNYKITTFRAGGWSITPFNDLRDTFLDSDIDMDFSVLPGDFLDQKPINYYDFRQANTKKWYWQFDTTPCVEEQNGRFYEIPVTRYRINPILFLVNKYLHSKSVNNNMSGVSASYTSFYGKMRKLMRSVKYASLDDIALKLNRIMVRKMKMKSVLCFVAHPKSFSSSTIQLLDQLLKRHKSLSVEMIREKIKETENK
ncbi:polysaccharide deacetylase family protein [Labilibaculum sp.]|uniref:polysaccharide deacetylase family protein n=1 Tax=Labilibaculum sp. TaxID=2060723 RepID=UPI002AA92E01|nr:polysaccharide deacetylase family protein [Labilibaculum sp.]